MVAAGALVGLVDSLIEGVELVDQGVRFMPECDLS
jgi:hypothetical protein